LSEAFGEHAWRHPKTQRSATICNTAVTRWTPLAPRMPQFATLRRARRRPPGTLGPETQRGHDVSATDAATMLGLNQSMPRRATVCNVSTRVSEEARPIERRDRAWMLASGELRALVPLSLSWFSRRSGHSAPCHRHSAKTFRTSRPATHPSPVPAQVYPSTGLQRYWGGSESQG
jgi:hypothetical protein